MREKRKVLILGYGEMGHAMEALLRDQHELMIWEKFPKEGFRSASLEESVPEADVILFCLPVMAHPPVASEVAPLLKPDTICLSIAKGLDADGKTAARIFEESFAPSQPLVLLYGPMISEEMRSGRPAFGQLGCKRDEDFDMIRDLFTGTPLYIAQCDDITGISWSVILKNVYALLFGMADELQLGDNVRGFLAVAALQELDRIVRKMGGNPGTPYHLAGLGDLVTTATSESSHHHELGRMLARGETENIAGEGVHTLAMVLEHGIFDVEDFPLFKLVAGVVGNPVDVRGRIMKLIESFF